MTAHDDLLIHRARRQQSEILQHNNFHIMKRTHNKLIGLLTTAAIGVTLSACSNDSASKNDFTFDDVTEGTEETGLAPRSILYKKMNIETQTLADLPIPEPEEEEEPEGETPEGEGEVDPDNGESNGITNEEENTEDEEIIEEDYKPIVSLRFEFRGNNTLIFKEYIGEDEDGIRKFHEYTGYYSYKKTSDNTATLEVRYTRPKVVDQTTLEVTQVTNIDDVYTLNFTSTDTCEIVPEYDTNQYTATWM